MAAPQRAPGADGAAEPSLGELIAAMTNDMSLLVRKEMELAKVEIKEEVSQAGKAAGAFGGTAIAGYMALLFLSFALALGLSALMPDGLAFLIVGVLYGAGAGVLFAQARERAKEIDPVPQQTVETIKEDVAWAKAQTR
ncbi:MAG: phage holin family protein [Acidimicrobiia bacterium]|nr:phage holin family protein [Acidimicrobiia bacterium]MBV9285248.1 phage holin family protein [Acidimicrobiia bacterium]